MNLYLIRFFSVNDIDLFIFVEQNIICIFPLYQYNLFIHTRAVWGAKLMFAM